MTKGGRRHILLPVVLSKFHSFRSLIVKVVRGLLEFLHPPGERLLLLLLLVLLRHDPRGLHADGDTLLEAAVLTVLPGLLRDGARAVLVAAVGCVAVDAATEEGAARVAGDGAVVDVVVGDVAAHLAGHLADEFGTFPLRLLGLFLSLPLAE